MQPLENVARYSLSSQAERQILNAKNAIRAFQVKLLVSNIWNALWFLIVAIFNIIVALGFVRLQGDGSKVCSYEQEPVTRLLPFLVFSPYASFVMNIFGESFAAALTLWAMLPTLSNQKIILNATQPRKSTIVVSIESPKPINAE